MRGQNLFLNEKSGKTSSPNLIMVIICLGIFIAAINQTVIYGALPAMMISIHLPVTNLDHAAWIVIGYLLGFTIAMPIMGKVSDVYGHGRIYILSLIIFLVGSIFVALAANLQLLVVARVLQAVGGGAVVPIAMAIAGDLFTSHKRAIAIGIIGAAAEAGGAIGPFYGAAIAQYWGWQWIFWINLPISIIIIAIILFHLGRSPRTKGRIDYLDGVLLAVGLAFFSLGLSQQSGDPYYLIYITGFLIGSLIFFTLFIIRTLRVSNPLLRLSMFKNSRFSTSNVTNLLVGSALIIAMVNIPLMSDTILGNSPLEGGLKLLRFTIVLSFGAVIGGFLCKRFSYRLLTIFGLILSSVGFFFMSRWTLSISDPQMTVHLAMCGFGFGMVIAPLNSVSEDEKGVASSVVVMMRTIGMIIGLSAITAWGMDRFHLMTAGLSLNDIITNPEQLTKSLLSLFNNFFMASAIICLIGIIPALGVGRNRNHQLREILN
jgi:EmrB/QacA subfamily drug resistance transporter